MERTTFGLVALGIACLSLSILIGYAYNIDRSLDLDLSVSFWEWAQAILLSVATLASGAVAFRTLIGNRDFSRWLEYSPKRPTLDPGRLSPRRRLRQAAAILRRNEASE